MCVVSNIFSINIKIQNQTINTLIMDKDFILKPEDIKDIISPMGFCLVSNLITMDGLKVGFMYRE